MSREVMYALAAILLLVLFLALRREHMTVNVAQTPPTSNPAQMSADFAQAVEVYRNNYIQYKTTGRVEFKTAYENAESWIQQYLKSMESQISNGRQSITSFVNQNAGADTELGVLGDKMKTIKREGPESQDAYITIKRIQDDIPEDNTDLYVKIGMVIAFIGVAAIV